MPDPCNYFVNLVARKLATLTGFGPLGHLDLEFVRIHKIVRSHAEPRRRHLLDRTASRVAVVIGLEPRLVLSTFSCIRLAADAVHRNGESLMRFFADRTK